jgi:hypothetical protein
LTAILTHGMPHKIGLMIAALAGIAAGMAGEKLANRRKMA